MITNYRTSSLGPIVTKYLNTRNDKTFGIVGTTDGKNYIGDAEVIFDNDNLIIKGEKYIATEGLMTLLTNTDIPNNLVTPEDGKNYEKILFDSNAIFRNNDPRTRHSKSSKSKKYLTIIKTIWEERMKKRPGEFYLSPQRTPKRGSGMRIYSEVPEKFVWMNDVRKLVDRLVVILGEEKSGNDNLYNEKVSIMKMFCDLLSNFILEDPKNIGHLIKIINMLPPKFWTKHGSGFVNDIINKLPFELHVPGYQYCGPGTNLEKRLARGDEGINPLDAACKNHDIAYRDHKSLDERHAADKVLENEALSRLFSKDASIGERLASLGTAVVMNRKVSWGMGWL